MPRFKLTVEYDGTGLAGWQRQKDRVSVQSLLEMAAEKLCGSFREVIGAGRTDAGVHATGQVAHVDIPREMNGYNVMHGLNFHLLEHSEQVIVTKAEQVPDDFHARFAATHRSYSYCIINRQARLALERNRAWHIHEKLDVPAMHAAAQLLVGHHDFSSFRSTECQSKSPIKTLDRLDVIRNGEVIHIMAESRSFLHHQVRNMVGTLRLIGNGKWQNHQITTLLAAKDRKLAGETAPAQGLTLTSVLYYT